MSTSSNERIRLEWTNHHVRFRVEVWLVRAGRWHPAPMVGKRLGRFISCETVEQAREGRAAYLEVEPWAASQTTRIVRVETTTRYNVVDTFTPESEN